MSNKAKPPINLLQYSAEPIYKVFPSDFKVFANNPKDFIPDDIATARQYWERNQELETEYKNAKRV